MADILYIKNDNTVRLMNAEGRTFDGRVLAEKKTLFGTEYLVEWTTFWAEFNCRYRTVEWMRVPKNVKVMEEK